MIRRIPGMFPTRSRAVVRDGIVTTVATADAKSQSLYEQARDTLRVIDRNLAEAGTTKSSILTAIVYIADMSRKPELNRAWDEWVDRDNPPMRACLGVALEGDALVEIVVTAEV